MLDVVLATVVAAHLAVILTMLTGGLLAWRWPRLVWVHAPVAISILALNLASSDCPLTALELWVRERGGRPGYSGGFVSHYLVQPWHPDGVTPAVRLAVYAVAVGPNLVAYAVLCRRRYVQHGPKPRARGDGPGGLSAQVSWLPPPRMP